MRYARQNCQVQDGGEEWIITGPCFVTGKPYTVHVSKSGMIAYNAGALIQDAFPELSVDDREFLMSGYTPEGWDLAFSGQVE